MDVRGRERRGGANEPGTYYVDGHADVYYGEGNIEYHYDQAAVFVPPPPPPPPTITFSATETITANYGVPEVIITAHVSPSGYGYESLVYWQGDGITGDTNLQRKFPTLALGTYSATAVIAGAGGGTEATDAGGAGRADRLAHADVHQRPVELR